MAVVWAYGRQKDAFLRELVRTTRWGDLDAPRSLSINPHEHVQNYNIFRSFWKRYHILWTRLA